MKPVAYTDLSALRGLDQNSPKSLQAVAKQFESMFVDMMLQAARSATAVLAEGNPFESNETSLHQEMLDHQLAVDMSEHGGIGLAPLLVRQLSKLVGGGETDLPGAKSVANGVPARRTAISLPLQIGAATAQASVNGLPPLHADSAARGQSANNAPLEPSTLEPPTIVVADVVRAAFALPERAGFALPERTGAAPLRALAQKHQAFANPLEFVRAVLPAIAKITAGTGIAPVAVLAQAALETGWGKSVIGDGSGGSSFNLFGVKSGAGWSGRSATVSTLEVRKGVPQREQAAFRVYDNIEHAVSDFVATLKGGSQYSSALSVADKPAAFARQIGKSGYATDPAYAQKLLRVLHSPTLAAALAAVAQEFGDVPAPGSVTPDKSVGAH